MGHLLDGKICLVTGASRGIGKEIANLFANEGAIVYAACRNPDTLSEWIAGHEKAGSFIPVALDVKDVESIKQVVMQIRKEHKQLDVLVNNAAVEYNELIGMISRPHMEEMFSTNVYGVIDLIQYCMRIMRKDGGSIINISSLVGLYGNKGQLVYSATKGAVIALTKSAAKELAEWNIRVNSVAPGLTKTDMMAAADMEKLRSRIGNISLGRLAKPSDIANVCLFLASDLANYISGQIVEVDGCTIM